MRRPVLLVISALLIVACVMLVDPLRAAQTTTSPHAAGVDVDAPNDTLLRWPLPAGAEDDAAMGGQRIHQDVVAQARISRRYRDQGHPKFWGRIIGTSADAESAEWLATTFRSPGMSAGGVPPPPL